jgi:hypothetical protein
VQGEGIRLRQWRTGARKPLAVQLDGAAGAFDEWSVAGEYGEGAGLLVGARCQVQIAVSLA